MRTTLFSSCRAWCGAGVAIFSLWGGLGACGGATAETKGLGIGAGAAGNAAMAAAAWAIGKGCNMQGCPYGSYCNHATGFCDTRKCDEGCPKDTACNEGLNRCQDPAPASPPNDFLPYDRQIQPIR